MSRRSCAIGAPNGRPTASPTRVASASATMTARRRRRGPRRSTRAYCNSGWKATARFDGIVQGVVVQISTETLRPASARHSRGELAGAVVGQRELDVDRRRRVVAVLDFGLGQRGAAMDAPVHRLLALVDQPLLHEPAERARDRRLIPEVHRDVGMVPVAEDAEPLEFLRHHADEPLGVGAARAPEVGHRHVAASSARAPARRAARSADRGSRSRARTAHRSPPSIAT